jgi:hypothetical protein
VLFLTFKSAVKIETGLKPVNHKQFSHVNGHKKTKAGGFLVGLLFFIYFNKLHSSFHLIDQYFTRNKIIFGKPLRSQHFKMLVLRDKNIREGLWQPFKAVSPVQWAG